MSKKIPKNIRKIISDVKQFSTTGCSGVPNGDFLDCCLEHDGYYKNPGYASRSYADKRLRMCIRRRGGFIHFILSGFYGLGVRFLGGGTGRRRLKEKNNE